MLHASGSNNASFMLAGHRACWLDSDEPQSKRIKYDAGKEVDFKKDGPRYSESVLRVHKSVVSLVASTGNFCNLGFCIHLLLLFIKHMMLLYGVYQP